MSQLELFQICEDFSDKSVLIPLSAGINSAAVLCYLATEYPVELRPKMVHIFYVHLIEHSPDSFRFVADCIRYAVKKLPNVRWAIRWDSVLRYFKKKNMIPHPLFSNCSEDLKIIPLKNYATKHAIDLDLIGYVRTERNRIKRQMATDKDHFKRYPIAHLTDDNCFDIVKREIGWYPAIYDIRERGKRVFHHNNCLPCKNMNGFLSSEKITGDYKKVELYYPDYFQDALDTANIIESYWGRQDKEKEFDGYCKFCEF